MKGFGEKNQSKIVKITKNKQKVTIDECIKKAFRLKAQGKKLEAAKYYELLIKKGTYDYRVFSNYGAILNEIGRHKEAELKLKKSISLNPKYANAYYNLAVLSIGQGNFIRAELELKKSIALKSDFAIAYYNLGFILKHLGRLKESESFHQKALAIDPQLTDAYLSLSTMQASDKNQKWQNQLFSDSLLKNKNKRELVNIFFARSNILHKQQNYEESSRYLKLANKLKLDLHPSKPEMIFNKSKFLLNESNKKEINKEKYLNSTESIFIVGMFRSGSTLLESILSMKNDVYDLGEINFLEESFFESKKSEQEINLAKLYWKKINNKTKLNITTNKNLFNYQFTGIIANRIPNAKIIHCFRHPLDNILSIYRAHFAGGNEYSSSLVDSAKVYLDQEELMTEYKNRFGSKIYDLNYDKLVSNPNQEIKLLISWLGWKWEDKYLSPHLNARSVTTASNVQVRSPINTKSLGGWKNYKEMLRPAIEILTKTDKYKKLLS